MPLLDSEVNTSEPFLDTELLYRRIPPDQLTNGELDPGRFRLTSFTPNVKGSPSVLRGRFASPSDAIHPGCTGQKDCSQFVVYAIAVEDLPLNLISGDGSLFSAFPLHDPEPTCGAHSVIATCKADDDTRAYAKPSKGAANDLRVKLAVRMHRVEVEVQKSSKAAPTHDSIANLAYFLWRDNGEREGQADEHWLKAEKLLREML